VLANGTTCGALLSEGSTCQATCADFADVVGYFRCLSGRLIDTSYCIGSEVSVKWATKIASSMTMQLSMEPSITAMRRCVASAIEVVPLSLVHRVSFHSTKRRLSQAQHGAPKGLNYTVDLEIITPDEVSSEILVGLAAGLAVDGSRAQRRLMNSLSEGFGIKASHISQLIMPRAFQTVIVNDTSGSIWGTSGDAVNESSAESRPMAGKDRSDNGVPVGAVIGYIVGGISALCLVVVGVWCMATHRTVKFDV